MEGSFIGTIVIWLIGLVLLYFVVYTAVKDGINKSFVGQYIEKNYDVKEGKNSFLNNDLDSD